MPASKRASLHSSGSSDYDREAIEREREELLRQKQELEAMRDQAGQPQTIVLATATPKKSKSVKKAKFVAKRVDKLARPTHGMSDEEKDKYYERKEKSEARKARMQKNAWNNAISASPLGMLTDVAGGIVGGAGGEAPTAEGGQGLGQAVGGLLKLGAKVADKSTDKAIKATAVTGMAVHNAGSGVGNAVGGVGMGVAGVGMGVAGAGMGVAMTGHGVMMGTVGAAGAGMAYHQAAMAHQMGYAANPYAVGYGPGMAGPMLYQ